jgi:Zn-dependent alcohol dehydrogenase
MKECPACLPPDNSQCNTCNGTSQITEETHSQFMIKKQELEAVLDLSHKIQETLHSNNSLEEISNSIKLILEEI